MRAADQGGPFPRVEFRVSLPEGEPARLVHWRRDAWSGPRGGWRDEQPSKVHVASQGILGAGPGTWMTWCGRPVPGQHEVAASAVGGNLCRPCTVRLTRPWHAPTNERAERNPIEGIGA